jgi:hypothetical protein
MRGLLGPGAAACLPAVTVAGGASAAAGSIWHVVPSENPQQHQVTNSLFIGVSGAAC